MTSIIEPVMLKTFEECIDFLLPREHHCITLTSQLAENGVPRFPKNNFRAFVCLRHNTYGPVDFLGYRSISGILFLMRNGTLLHCFGEDFNPADYQPELGKFISSLQIRCILGTNHGTRLLESLTKRKLDYAVDYQLMTIDSPLDRSCEEQFPGEIESNTHIHPEIIRAVPENIAEMLHLQEGYEREEVIPPGNPFDRESCRRHLAATLQNQYVYAIRVEKQYLAKAGTNARGIHWDQIGGVYTDPAWRNHGFASAIVTHTVRNRMDQRRHVALFVKLTNTTARAIYERIGFKVDDQFRISYY